MGRMVGRCSRCQARLVWLTNAKGRPQALDAATVRPGDGWEDAAKGHRRHECPPDATTITNPR